MLRNLRSVSSTRFVVVVIVTASLITLALQRPLDAQHSAMSANAWTIYGYAPIMLPSLSAEGANNIYAPDVHKEQGVWKMWYGAQDASGHDAILYATSPDGITWDKHGVVLDNPGYVGNSPILDNDPSVVAVGGTYYMYYTEHTDRDRINLATSADGVAWQRQGVVLDLTANEWGKEWTGRPSVLFEDNTFKLWYDSRDTNGLLGVGYATSPDGIHFTKSPANPVLRNTIGAVDVKHVGNQYIMVYQDPDRHIDWAASPDETHFTAQGQLIRLTGGRLDAYGDVTPDIYLDEQGNWTRTYFGGASHGCWCNNSMFMAFNDNYPIAGQKQVVIRGYKLGHGTGASPIITVQPVSFDGALSNTNDPYFIYETFYEATRHTISVPKLDGYSIGYTLCIDSTTCHSAAPMPGNEVTISSDLLSKNGFVDLWWHYTPELIGPTPTQP